MNPKIPNVISVEEMRLNPRDSRRLTNGENMKARRVARARIIIISVSTYTR